MTTEIQATICLVWAVSMFLNFEPFMLNKMKASMWSGVVISIVENWILYRLGSEALVLVLPLSAIGFFVSLKVSATVSAITGRFGNAAHQQ